jgi:hypothetical protein
MMAELTGLILVGSAFPEFRQAAAWCQTGLRLLNQQAAAQTHPDGANKEEATGYHRFVAELLLLIVTRSRQGALPQVPSLESTLERMLDYVLFSMTPIGTAPMWGDSDYGRALGLGLSKDFWDFRPVLSAGAALFGRRDWKSAAGRFDEEAFWLLGAEGLDWWNRLDVRPAEQTSRAFPEAGMYIIRDAWAADSDVAFFRCGPFGLGGEGHCAHAHCDLLSIVLWVHGQPLLVDSGTFTYHGPWRDQFRFTAAHNTVRIDGREQAIPMPNFNWQQVPQAKCTDWTEKEAIGSLAYPNNIHFTRRLVHPRPGVWELVDTFAGHDEHKMEWNFHFAPDLNLQLNEAEHMLTVLKEGQPFVIVRIPGNGIHPELRNGWFSYNYGVKRCNRALYGRWQGNLDGQGVLFHWQFQLANRIPLPLGGQSAAAE